MSVYGGDSWAREAHHRKRRVDELMLDGVDGSSFKKLSNGKFTCLVCPHNPLLDSSLMLSLHSKGVHHRTALSRLKERGLMRQEEINKRVALSGHPISSTSPGISAQNSRLPSKPLIEQTRKVASEILHNSNAPKGSLYEKLGVKCSSSTSNHIVGLDHCQVNSNYTVRADVATTLPTLDFRELREKELKFTAAGWKRDCHGKWYRDENVEFDSDEEDPNVILA